MRVVVSSLGKPLNQQILSYAEYRIYSTLSTHDDVVNAHVSLSNDNNEVQCRVQVTRRASDAIETRTSGSYAAAAINRAAERVAALLEHAD